jgi:hypothetical protein
MATDGASLAKNSKTFERKLMGVRSPLPAPFQIRHLVERRNISLGSLTQKLCQFCARARSLGDEQALLSEGRAIRAVKAKCDAISLEPRA